MTTALPSLETATTTTTTRHLQLPMLHVKRTSPLLLIIIIHNYYYYYYYYYYYPPTQLNEGVRYSSSMNKPHNYSDSLTAFPPLGPPQHHYHHRICLLLSFIY